MSDFYTVQIEHLIWNELNIAHIARHDVIPNEVEEACFGEHIATDTYNNRVLLIGVTEAGRVLAVILALRTNGAYFPITARHASRKERTLYETHQVKEAA